MKSILFLIVFTAFAFFSNAQDSTVVLSKFEKMATAPGYLYRFNEKMIGTVHSQNIAVIKIKSINTADSSSVIRISPSSWDNTPVIGRSVFYIGKEDIGGVVKTLEYYAGQIKNNEPFTSPYLSYITSNDIQILCKSENHLFSTSYLSFTKVYQYLRTPVLFSSVYFNNKKEIDRLIDLLKTAATDI